LPPIQNEEKEKNVKNRKPTSIISAFSCHFDTFLVFLEMTGYSISHELCVRSTLDTWCFTPINQILNTLAVLVQILLDTQWVTNSVLDPHMILCVRCLSTWHDNEWVTNSVLDPHMILCVRCLSTWYDIQWVTNSVLDPHMILCVRCLSTWHDTEKGGRFGKDPTRHGEKITGLESLFCQRALQNIETFFAVLSVPYKKRLGILQPY